MTEQEFADNLDRFGADISQWPEPLRQPGQHLLEQSTSAQQHRQQAQVMEQMLAAATTHQAPDHLAPQIMAKLAQQPTADAPNNTLAWVSWFASPWRGALTALIPLVIGFSAGWSSATEEQAEFWGAQSEDAVYGLALSDSAQEYYSEDS